MNQSGEPDPLYVLARRALLDALEALGPHRRAVVLVGAQAVYLHVGEAQEPLSSFTIDADLALNPAHLLDEPALETALRGEGFERREQPGLWFTADNVEVDLLVPASIAGAGSRGADLGAHHDRLAAMRAAGLEAALVDNIPHAITALDSRDRRSFTIAVAGPAALLVAKLHKVGERETPRMRTLLATGSWTSRVSRRSTSSNSGASPGSWCRFPSPGSGDQARSDNSSSTRAKGFRLRNSGTTLPQPPSTSCGAGWTNGVSFETQQIGT